MNLDKIKKRCEAATEGPWNIWDGPVYAGGGEDLCIGSGDDWVVNMDHRIAKNHDRFHDVDLCDICSGITEEQRFNAEFIAHARTDIPDLIAAYERQKTRADHTYKQVPALKKRIVELEEEKDKLRTALQALLDEQNGPPLYRDEKTWQKAVDVAEKLIYGDK